MSEQFHVRFATPADADTIGWHRARMFQDTMCRRTRLNSSALDCATVCAIF